MNKIKIVKKDDKPVSRVKKRKMVPPRNAAREMVATVGDWVTEFKARKTAETKAAIELISGRDAWPNEG